MAYENELRSDIDAIKSPLPVIPAPKTDRFMHRDFTMQEMQYLSQLAELPHYQVLLKLMEGICERAETEHFQEWKNREAFDRTGATAVAQRIFFERVQKEVLYQKEELASFNEERQIDESLKATPAAELIRRQIEGA